MLSFGRCDRGGPCGPDGRGGRRGSRTRRVLAPFLACASLLLLVPGGGGAQAPPDPGAPAGPVPDTAAAAGTPAGAPGAGADAEAFAGGGAQASVAEVMPGDRIRLAVWREPDWSGQFEVDERGVVVLPRLGPTEVAGHTVGEVRTLLTDLYGEHLRTPAVEVVVLRRIGVHGEVRMPTLYWVDLTMTLRDAIAMAGGLTPAGDPNRVVVERGGERLRFTEAETAAALTAGLASGDHIVIGRRSWMSLNAPLVISTAVSVASILAGFILAR